MIYAPVLIPTLNRYEHLRQCLESLSQCTWANKTEVFVALDYPPADKWDKYAPGWEKNREWLRSVGNMGFKKLHLIERTRNYGIWTSKLGNLDALINDVKQKYKYYIISEDDNVFSPCFIEYMNKGIEKFKDDESVMALCGYSYPYPILHDSNTFYRQSTDFSAWGCVCFYNHYPSAVNYQYMRQFLSLKMCLNLYKKYGSRRLAAYISACNKDSRNLNMTDVNISLVGSLLDKDFIMPTKSLVRNIGADGSGINFIAKPEDDPVSAMLLSQEISNDISFEYIGTGMEYYDENREILVSHSWGKMSNKKLLSVMVKSFVKRIIRG